VLCAAELAWAAAYTARNYAGFADKVTPAGRPAYTALLDTLATAARRVEDPVACDVVLDRWVAVFRDRHLSTRRMAAPAGASSVASSIADTAASAAVSARSPGAPVGGTPMGPEAPDVTPAALRARFAAWPRVPVDEAAARARIAALGAARTPVEGVWESTGDGIRYRVAVLRDTLVGPHVGASADGAGAGPTVAGATAPAAAAAPTYTMLVLRADSAWWTPGQVKAHLTVDTSAGTVRGRDTDPAVSAGAYRMRLYRRDHTPAEHRVRIEGNVLRWAGSPPWVRRWPQAPGDLPDAALEAEWLHRFAVRDLAPGTLYLRLPTFMDARGIDSLFAAEGARIRAAERLLIDVRGNGGGNDLNYRHLQPLLYTQPVRSPGVLFLATEDNLRGLRRIRDDTAGVPARQRALVAGLLPRFEARRGGWVTLDDAPRRETRPDPTVLARPRRVAVLYDRGCGSSCEQFLLEARQSRKVTLYGAPSAGALDYSNVFEARAADASTAGPGVPGSTLVLVHPTTRSQRLPAEPVDNVGVLPAVPVSADEPLPVDRVRRHLEAADTAAQHRARGGR